MTRFLVVLAPLALVGCITEQTPTLPMALAPADTAQANCLTYGNTPTFGDCETQRGTTTQ